jgi:hypothetical protein
MTADESGRILVNKLNISSTGFELVEIVFEIRSEQSISMLLHDPSGTRILFHGRETTEIWTTAGQKLGEISRDDNGETSFVNHPLRPECFLTISQDGVRAMLWGTGSIVSNADDEQHGVSLKVTPPTPTLKQTVFSQEKFEYCDEPWNGPFIISKGNGVGTSPAVLHSGKSLRIWPASSITASEHQPKSVPIHNFLRHENRIRQIVCVTDSLLIFLDTDLWICSLDVSSLQTISTRPRRHFFLLSEWRSVDRSFTLHYVSATQDFVLAKKHGILVVSQRLELEEPWIKETDVE